MRITAAVVESKGASFALQEFEVPFQIIRGDWSERERAAREAIENLVSSRA